MMPSGLLKWFGLLGGIIAICYVITACSANEGTTTAGVGTGGTGTIIVIGKVADGYLANATVFLDKNGNYRHDEGEPSTTTDANGAYALTLDSTEVGRYPVVVSALSGTTIDKDSGLPVSGSYLLSLPKESVTGQAAANFISPVSTQLREMLETGLYGSLHHAADVLRTKLGLPAGTDVAADYIAGNTPAMHVTAQNMATLMGNQAGLVMGSNYATAQSPVDINRYRGMMGAVFNNLSSIRKPYDPARMTNLSNALATTISKIPPPPVGEPFHNMSSSYREEDGGQRHD
jgi:hypothetical protein